MRPGLRAARFSALRPPVKNGKSEGKAAGQENVDELAAGKIAARDKKQKGQRKKNGENRKGRDERSVFFRAEREGDEREHRKEPARADHLHEPVVRRAERKAQQVIVPGIIKPVRQRPPEQEKNRDAEQRNRKKFLPCHRVSLLPGSIRIYFPQQCLYFLPDPQGQGSLRPTFGVARTIVVAARFPST